MQNELSFDAPQEHTREELEFQKDLAERLRKSLEYVIAKGYDLSEGSIAKYQNFFDKQDGYREGKSSFEELLAIPEEVVTAARVWKQHENNKVTDAEAAKEREEADRIRRIVTNLDLVEKALVTQLATDDSLREVMAQLRSDTAAIFTRLEEDHFYYLYNDEQLTV